jgi:protein subunit release factor B
MGRQLLFSVTKKDFKIEAIRGSGPGGQHRNKKHTGVRITHSDSGAVGQATEERSQDRNKKKAFRRLVESDKFRKWHKLECARRTGEIARIEEDIKRRVEEAMRPENLKIEYYDPNKN